jgi:hypothetical protein
MTKVLDEKTVRVQRGVRFVDIPVSPNGTTVARLRMNLTASFSGDQKEPVVANGVTVEDSHTVHAGDSVEFVRAMESNG